MVSITIPKGMKIGYGVWKFDTVKQETGELLGTSDSLKSLFKRYGNEGVIYGMAFVKKNVK